ncbi:MAG: hypothetical protein QOI31_423 [Solirubrobacterales bacterium]|jgi:pimeloyl-ACP methyl ester carboxylesterase|nr:hypothetical protein [Solirubrobacterales bacterium]
MPEVTAPDGVSLHWEERGSGPSVLLSPYWAMHPSIFDPIEAVLEHDFRVVRFDERGTGESDRVGPYDMATGVSDLETICETAGPFDVALCLVDSANRAVRVARSQPDLMTLVFCVGSAPFGVGGLKDSDSLLSSETVVRTYLQQLEADYRGAVRAALAGANTHLSDDEVRNRVQIQMEYIDAEAASVRAREWAADSGAEEPGKEIGSRLSVCLSNTMGGPGAWFPSGVEMEPVVREFFPQAQIYWTADGIVSTPHEIVEALKTSLVAAAGSQTYHRQP